MADPFHAFRSHNLPHAPASREIPGPGQATSSHKKTTGKVAFSTLIMGSDAVAVVLVADPFCQ
jgi:hypothetical protein